MIIWGKVTPQVQSEGGAGKGEVGRATEAMTSLPYFHLHGFHPLPLPQEDFFFLAAEMNAQRPGFRKPAMSYLQLA